jgi:hypothetical protein
MGCDRIDPRRPGDVLQRLLAEIGELGLDPAAYVFERGAGNANASRFGDLLKAGCDIHPVAEQVVAFDQDIADRDPDPVEDALAFSAFRIALRHLLLHGERTFNGGDNGWKLDQHPIAHCLEQSTAVRRKNRRCGFAPLAHSMRGPRLVLPHHARVPDDVRGKDRGKSSDLRHSSTPDQLNVARLIKRAVRRSGRRFEDRVASIGPLLTGEVAVPAGLTGTGVTQTRRSLLARPPWQTAAFREVSVPSFIAPQSPDPECPLTVSF